MFIKKYTKGDAKITKFLFGLVKTKKTPCEKKVYLLGIKIQHKTNIISVIYQQQYETLLSSWHRHGASDELLANLKLLASSPNVFNKMPNQTWLIYISCLLERNIVDEAKKILKRYLYMFGTKDIKHYFLASALATEYGITDERIRKTANVWSKLNDNSRNKSFHNYLKNKRIAVVGGSGCELGKNKGEEIDKHDIVIRFANYPTEEKYFIDYGKKTTLWIRTSSVDLIHKPDISEYDWVIWRADLHHTYITDEHIDIMYDYLSQKNSKLVILEPELYKDLDKKYDIYRPTAGCVILYYLYNLLGSTNNIDVYGFSFLSKDYNDTKHYFDNVCKVAINHDMKYEIDLLSEIYSKN